MFRNMVTSLFKYERIRTTDVKAKELRRWADNLITLAKRGDLHARRQAFSIVREKNVVHKLFEEANERFGTKKGGYTRIIKLGRRPGDAAEISLIELVTLDKGKKKKEKKDKVAAIKQEPKEIKAEADKEQKISAETKSKDQPEDAFDEEPLEAKLNAEGEEQEARIDKDLDDTDNSEGNNKEK